MARILVIDDEPAMRQMLRHMLEGVGYEVMDAGDGVAGMDLFRQSPADLVVTDILMPERDGLELIRLLLREYPDVKIIATSGGGRIRRADYLMPAQEFGAHRTLSKPFERQQLLDAVAELLEEPEI